MTSALDGMPVFIAVAEARSFRAAGDRLGVTSSAVSQALRRLEDRLGVALVLRTTRSVHLTEAGERLYASARPAIEQLESALATVGALGDEPRGTIRLLVSPSANRFLSGSLLAGFLTAHRHVQLDLVLSHDPTDIVAEGYDAGIKLSEQIDRDMMAIPLSGDLRLLVVGAPSYFARRAKPKHPRDLAEHECLNWRPTADSPPYRWEFTEAGREFSIAVPARVLCTDPAINLRLALEGVGLTVNNEAVVRDAIQRGELVSVLDEFSTPFEGFYLYYPHGHHLSPAMNALVEYLRRVNQARLKGA